MLDEDLFILYLVLQARSDFKDTRDPSDFRAFSNTAKKISETL